MNSKQMILSFFLGCMMLNITAAPKPVREVYVPMDYSTCGYHASEMVIPNVRSAVWVEAVEGDCSSTIQQAIDYVSSLKPDANGHRGAVLLAEGTFLLDDPLRISQSGVVIRGMGKQRTILVKRGFDRGAAIYLEGKGSSVNTENPVIAEVQTFTKAGSTELTLTQTKGIAVGSRIQIIRPSTAEWIASLKMTGFGGGLDYTGWHPTDIDITWERVVTAVNGNRITLDAPITTTLSPDYGGAQVKMSQILGEIVECGVENLTLVSDYNKMLAQAVDEDHCWDAIWMNGVRDAWVRRVDFKHFAGSAVNLQKKTSRITVEDCIASEPVSEIGGWRRSVFLTRGQQTLFQRCISRQGIHDFAADFCAAGPNAFVQCEGEESLGFSGSIGSWAAGLLFDIVNIDGNDLSFRNLEQFQTGTGWNTANSMFWQCTASTLYCYSPDADDRCSAHGCWGTLTGDGEWTSSNDHVKPRSLFYDQLSKRVPQSPVNPYLLPRNLEATTSPTVEQAMQMAQLSLQKPRLTMEMWIDSVILDQPIILDRPKLSLKSSKPASTQPSRHAFSILNGHLAVDGSLLMGNLYDIPWWNGRVKDNFVAKSARPAITRFVPGREGTGWTDRLDSVVDFLHRGDYVALDHHYGLWYDLRRTDHERIRRADGDVWAPFYEQPFARTGQGKAWDGLSRYDLTKPNEWYWQRLRCFAEKAEPQQILLFNQHYFQHNILEAGAHWVDCPWRPVNNVNGTDFPEPVPFAGDKRIFLAEQFYNEQNPVLRPLHKQYIRMCLEELKDQPNVVHLISSEYTGPLHFTRFWLETIAEWEQETGRHPLIALSCTKDAQDAILADPILNKVVDIIDIRYWHYNTQGLWAPEAGKNMAPRQWMRKMPVGKTGFDEAYRAVREYRERYPDKAVTFFSQQYPSYGWAILMAGGSMPNVVIADSKLRSDLCRMRPMDGTGCVALGDEATGYLIYATEDQVRMPVADGTYQVSIVHPKSGEAKLSMKSLKMKGQSFEVNDTDQHRIYWLKRK